LFIGSIVFYVSQHVYVTFFDYLKKLYQNNIFGL
jgi:hypothetical protein